MILTHQKAPSKKGHRPTAGEAPAAIPFQEAQESPTLHPGKGSAGLGQWFTTLALPSILPQRLANDKGSSGQKLTCPPHGRRTQLRPGEKAKKELMSIRRGRLFPHSYSWSDTIAHSWVALCIGLAETLRRKLAPAAKS
ncbi:hypothetical protein GWK47_039402 [Chionoecetes opilio]|uniref:Uncharacterized protein n=1 Tax=Chionoecetes opilio TaxID=41210 RepID=A0A8J5D1C9_CHIOP|nr:hypothetical protein GWK47_039402 [Chionoecetes opilio]